MTVITTKTIDSWTQFDEIVKRRHPRKWVYRGQADATWKLESSLYRAFRDTQDIHQLGGGREKRLNEFSQEETMIERFKSNAHLFLPHLPEKTDDFSWLALMQHYGAPTRLLDFTFSPYVAAFFCLESGTGNAAIYSLEHSILKQDDKNHNDQDSTEIYQNIMEANDDAVADTFIYAFEPQFSNERLMRQQGLFLIPNILTMSHESILEDYSLPKERIVKYILPAKLRASGIKHLHQMNITANILFPGLEGFCNSMKFHPLFALRYQKRVA